MTARPTTLWVLRAPDGRLVADTATTDRDDTWMRAYAHIGTQHADQDWHGRYWKRWDESQRSARRAGWRLVRARLVEVSK